MVHSFQVGVVQKKDPMGSDKRWFVDNGLTQGFLPYHVLTAFGDSPEIGQSRQETVHPRSEALQSVLETNHLRPEITPSRTEVLHSRPEMNNSRPEIVPSRPEVLHARPELNHSRPEMSYVEANVESIELSADAGTAQPALDVDQAIGESSNTVSII